MAQQLAALASARSRPWGCKCGGNSRKSNVSRCGNIDTSTPILKPDLAIYSQAEELQNGNIPSWDSPDIVTNNWRPFRLMPEARVKVRNISASVPAIQAQVHYYIAPFGIGTRREHKLTKVISLPPMGETELLFPLDQDTLGGDPRVGLHIVLEHPHDPNAINNVGAQVHDGGYTTESGRNFTVDIPVFNDSHFSREIVLSLMPTDLIASVTPSSRVFAPFEQFIAQLHIQVPGLLVGTADNVISRAVTVVGRLSSGELIGGATRLLRIDN